MTGGSSVFELFGKGGTVADSDIGRSERIQEEFAKNSEVPATVVSPKPFQINPHAGDEPRMAVEVPVSGRLVMESGGDDAIKLPDSIVEAPS